MEISATVPAAFLIGLFGSIHCVGMCGGIVGAFTLGLPQRTRESYGRLLPYLLSYNAGRIASYAAAGALVGWLGGQASQVFAEHAQLVGRLIAAAFMLALGLYLADWWRGLVRLEQLGAHLWRRIEPLGRRFVPVTSPARALGLGLAWGWLPCGLVYSALALALIAGSAGQGALLMLAFGAGTLPMLLTVGSAGRWLDALVKRPLARRAAGLAMIALAAIMVLPGGHAHHAADGNQPGEAMHHHH